MTDASKKGDKGLFLNRSLAYVFFLCYKNGMQNEKMCIRDSYTIDDVDVDVLENTITFNLGDIEPGYAPNDGYVIFYVSVIE